MKINVIQTIFLVIIIIFTKDVCSQNYIQFSQYIYTQGILNPAYSGTRNSISGLMLYRNQWLGIKGAPASQAFNIHAPLRALNVGVGLSAVNEQIGMKNLTNVNAAFSYILKLQSYGSLSFGIQAGIKNYNFDKSKALLSDSEDPFFTNGNESFLLPDFGFGMYYFTKRWFSGLSMPQLISGKVDIENRKFTTGSFSFGKQHYFLYGGYVFELNPDLLFRPCVLANGIYGSPLQLNINTSFRFKKRVWAGLGYRTGEAMIIFAEFNIYKYLSLGYSYDFVLNKLKSYNSGSHEIRLAFDLGLNDQTVPVYNSIRDF